MSEILTLLMLKSWSGRSKIVGWFSRTIRISATLLALTQAKGPSVIQERTQDVAPLAIGKLVINALRQFQPQLEKGALIVLDEAHARARILPLKV